MRIRSPWTLALCIGASLLAGGVGSLFMGDSIATWYTTLTKPSWTPPNYVFGPVWTTLYVLMGTAAYLVIRTKKLGSKLVGWFFFAHLLVNAFWSIAFFTMHEVLLAAFVIVLLWVLIVMLIIAFYRYSRAASYLMVPYLLWVTYATTLNIGFLFLN